MLHLYTQNVTSEEKGKKVLVFLAFCIEIYVRNLTYLLNWPCGCCLIDSNRFSKFLYLEGNGKCTETLHFLTFQSYFAHFA